MAIGSPLGYPYKPAAVYTTKARLYTLRYLCAKARLYTPRCLPPRRYELRCGVTTKALRIMLRCLHTNALRICCGFYTKALRNSYGGVYDGISTEVLRPEVSVIAPKDAEVVTITEAGLFRSP